MHVRFDFEFFYLKLPRFRSEIFDSLDENDNLFRKFVNGNSHFLKKIYGIILLSAVTQSCLTLYHPVDCSTPGFPVHHQLPELTQTHVHQVGDTDISSSVISFTSCLQSFPGSGSFPMS